MDTSTPTTFFRAGGAWVPMRVPALVLVAAVALAGCAAPPGETPQEARPAGAPVTDPGTPAPKAEDLGHQPHLHDYWMGKERVTLFDDTVEPGGDPFDALGPTFFTREPKVWRTSWTLPDGAIVFEGTGRLEVTATWSDPATTSLAMLHRPHAGAAWTTLALPQGKTVGIDVTPAMTDMPHTKASRWRFAFEPAQPGAALGAFDLKLDIVKMGDIAMFPAHPELFEGLPEKVLHDAEHAHTEVSYAKRVPDFAMRGEFGEKVVAPSELVPMETKAMRIEVDVLEATSTPGVVADIRFFYHGADTTFLGHPYVLPYEGSLREKRLVYQIPVTMEQTDTPYGEESQWRFFVEPTSKFVGDDNEPDCGGCADVSIRYRLKVIAYDHELDAYSKMEGEE